jgi:Flp pilus assembly protein TadD
VRLSARPLRGSRGRALSGAGDAWFARGRVFESLGPLEEAEAAYRRAAELEPDDVWWHSNLGGVLVKRGSYEEAIASLRRALELDPWHSAARFSLARAYGLSGDLQRARKLRAASS